VRERELCPFLLPNRANFLQGQARQAATGKELRLLSLIPSSTYFEPHFKIHINPISF
jgi:hypothetical protein